MNINVDISDYLSDGEIKSVVKDTLSRHVYNSISKESVDRLIGNISYEFIFELVNKKLDEDISLLIRDKVIDLINNLSSYYIFREKDAYGDASVGQKILNDEVEKSRDLIKSKVNEVISDYEFYNVRDSIGDVVYECVMSKLFGNKDEE